jgi:4-hydroxymandelate oxidase
MPDQGQRAPDTIRPPTPSRRQAMGAVLRAPDPAPLPVPRADLVNVLEYEAQARLALGPAKAAAILGSDRSITDRITLRPRMNVPTLDLDLTVNLFGQAHFTPIIVGPMAGQKRFHPEGEIATARGASAAKAGLVVSCDASVPLPEIAQAMTTPLWVQVYAGRPGTKDVVTQANAAKARTVVVTVNADAPTRSAIDWAGVEAVVRSTSLPVVVKGITQPKDAKEAVARGAQGVVVSNYRGGDAARLPGTLLLVAPVVQAVGGQVPVLVDGSFRRGTDILKALSFGARAVLIGRPAMWGLAAYGTAGVQGVVEMLQTELGRYMCMCGLPSLAAIDSSVARVHAPFGAP